MPSQSYRNRRTTALLTAPVVLASALLTGCGSGATASAATTRPSLAAAASVTSTAYAALARIERQYHANLGVYALDTGTGRTIAYNADERFAFASTIKALAAAVLLKRDTDAQLDTVIRYSESDLVDYSPVTSEHVATGMTLRDIMIAALEVSDNTAQNLMLSRLGGPSGLQAALRAMGDATTDADRTEPTVNSATPGDIRDTSTPRAMGTDLRAFVLGHALSPDRRRLLTSWLVANTTGGPYIRAGVPAGWTVGDKTGNAYYGTRNDIAIVWPSGGGAPMVVSILTNRGPADQNAASNDALIADATKAAIAALS